MQTYSEFRPTGFDSSGAFLDDDRQDWLVVPVSQTRDSGCLDQSNFASALKMLGGESETVEVHRFGHWGPGWFEIIIVDPQSPEAKQAADIEERLENYPVLDEFDLSERESEAEDESYRSWAERDFIRGIENRFGAEESLTATSEQWRELFDSTAREANVDWMHDDSGASINIDRIVDAVKFEDVLHLIGFQFDADLVADVLSQILESPLAGTVCRGTARFHNLLSDLRAGRTIYPDEARELQEVFHRASLLPEFADIADSVDHAYWELDVSGLPGVES